MTKKKPTPAETRHAIFVAAGRKGGHTGTKSTKKARETQLINEGADVDATGQVIPGPGTEKAKKKIAARLQLARAQKHHENAKAEEQAARQGQGDEGPPA